MFDHPFTGGHPPSRFAAFVFVPAELRRDKTADRRRAWRGGAPQRTQGTQRGDKSIIRRLRGLRGRRRGIATKNTKRHEKAGKQERGGFNHRERREHKDEIIIFSFVMLCVIRGRINLHLGSRADLLLNKLYFLRFTDQARNAWNSAGRIKFLLYSALHMPDDVYRK